MIHWQKIVRTIWALDDNISFFCHNVKQAWKQSEFFIFNRDKFRLENPHERTVMLFCGLLFLPAIVFIYPLVKENFDYDLPFIFFILINYIMYRFMSRYYIKKKKGIEIMREKPLLFGSQRFSCIMSWVIYPLWGILLYYMIKYKYWLNFI